MDTAEAGEETGRVAALHQALVTQLRGDGYVQSERVEVAFRAVPRHIFLPGVPLETVYSNVHVPTAERDGRVISSSSQPCLMAAMLEQLDLRPGQHVLEVGAGTGYNAALMAHIVGVAGSVTTVDLDDDIVAGARAHLADAGYDRVRVVCGDGAAGCAETTPYDRIMVTTAAPDIAPAWFAQLAPGGRLVLPLALTPLMGRELLVAFDRVDDHLESAAITYCGFLPMRGAFAGVPPDRVRLGAVSVLDLNYAAERLHLRAYPHQASCEPTEHETVIDKPHTRLVLTYAEISDTPVSGEDAKLT